MDTLNDIAPMHGKTPHFSRANPLTVFNLKETNLASLISAVVLDLPQLYTKPTASDLLRVLDLLTLRPHSFKDKSPSHQALQHLSPSDVTRYLTSIVSSGLSWISSDELRESIWDATSARLCERAGRSAMSSMSRDFEIPITEESSFSVTLHEPSITSDNLGMKTWVSSYLLSKRLHEILLSTKPNTTQPSGSQPLRAMELGAGTGLVGISFAVLCGASMDVHLTDLDDIVPNLAHNVTLNEELLTRMGSSVSTGVLDWSIQDEEMSNDKKYNIILAADPLYSPDHPRWLVQTIKQWLGHGADSRVIVEMPLRDAYLPQVEEFKKRMSMVGLKVVQEGKEIGYDDWEAKDGSPLEVRCWWSVWGWGK